MRSLLKRPTLTTPGAGLDKAAADGTYALKRVTRLPAIKTAALISTMASPPTIAVPAGVAQTTSGTTGSLLTAPVNYPYNTTGKWRYLGGSPYTSGSSYYANGGMFSTAAAAAGNSPPWRVEFMHDGQVFEFAFRANQAAGTWRLMVDGQWANAATVPPAGADGLRYLPKVDFGSRAVRRITLEFDTLIFGGVNTAGTDTIWQAAAPETRVLVFGDSFTAGTGATRPGTAWPTTMQQLLGWDDVWINGESGTGYAYPGTAPSDTFINRLAPIITAMGSVLPDVVIVWGGYNDDTVNSITAAQAGAAATALYAQIATLAPKADLIVVGPQSSPLRSASAQYATIKAAALAAPNLAAFIDNRLAADVWLTGSGRVGAPNGTGNSDVLVFTDNVHPSQEGHDYYGQRIARAIRDYYQSQAHYL